MNLIVIDLQTGTRTRISVPVKARPDRARRWVLRQLDRIGSAAQS